MSQSRFVLLKFKYVPLTKEIISDNHDDVINYFR